MAVTTGASEPKTEAHLYKYKWLAVVNGNTGSPLVSEVAPVYADRSVQITGTFGSGGSVSIEGSNDGGTTWAVLNDAFGNALTFTGAEIKQITEVVEQIRPNVTAGDGTTSLNVYLYMRKINV